MALNSTPSRSMSLGRHHSSMFPITPTQQEKIRKHTWRQTNTGGDAKIPNYHHMLIKQQRYEVFATSWLSSD